VSEKPLQLTGSPCIATNVAKCERYLDKFSGSLATFLVSFNFFVTLTVFEIFAKNWFNALSPKN